MWQALATDPSLNAHDLFRLETVYKGEGLKILFCQSKLKVFSEMRQNRAFVKTRNVAPQRRAANFAKVKAAGQAMRQANRAPAARAAVFRNYLAMETKFYDTAKIATNVAASIALTGGEYDPALPAGSDCISAPGQGDTSQNRDGKKIILKNVQIKGLINRPLTEDGVNPPLADTINVYLVQDTQTNGQATNSEDVYKNGTGDVNGTACAIRNLDFGPRYRVLKHETFDMSARTMSAEGDNLHSTAGIDTPFDWFVDLKDLPVSFNAGTTPVVANVIDNSLHVIAFSTAGLCSITYNARIRFQG